MSTGLKTDILHEQVTTAERDAIANPSSGRIVYNTDVTSYQYWNSTAWVDIGANVASQNTLGPYGPGRLSNMKITMPNSSGPGGFNLGLSFRINGSYKDGNGVVHSVTNLDVAVNNTQTQYIVGDNSGNITVITLDPGIGNVPVLLFTIRPKLAFTVTANLTFNSTIVDHIFCVHVPITSITSANFLSTVTTTVPHGYSTGMSITIKGSDQREYNGTHKIIVTGASTFTFVNDGYPVSPATGTMQAAIFGAPTYNAIYIGMGVTGTGIAPGTIITDMSLGSVEDQNLASLTLNNAATANRTATNLVITALNAHPSWVTWYPPVDNPAAWARYYAKRSGAFRIPGIDTMVGMPKTLPSKELEDLAIWCAPNPFDNIFDTVAGGTLPDTTYYVRRTFVMMSGQESFSSPEANHFVPANHRLVIKSPSPAAQVAAYNVYVGRTTGEVFLQNQDPIPLGTDWTEPTTGLLVGIDTFRVYNTGTGYTLFDRITLAEGSPLLPATIGINANITYTIASITRVGSTATVTTDDNHLIETGTKVIIAGAVEPEYNGTFIASVIDPATNVFTYTVSGTPTTPATPPALPARITATIFSYFVDNPGAYSEDFANTVTPTTVFTQASTTGSGTGITVEKVTFKQIPALIGSICPAILLTSNPAFTGDYTQFGPPIFRLENADEPSMFELFSLNRATFVLDGTQQTVTIRNGTIDLGGTSIFGIQPFGESEEPIDENETIETNEIDIDTKVGTPRRLIVEDVTIIDTDPLAFGSNSGIQFQGITSAKRVLAENTQNGFNLIGPGLYEDIYCRHNGLRSGDHGSCVTSSPQNPYLDVDGYWGYYRFNRFNFEVPCALSPDCDNTTTTGALVIWNNNNRGGNASASHTPNAGNRDIVFENGRIDGGAWPIVIEPYRETLGLVSGTTIASAGTGYVNNELITLNSVIPITSITRSGTTATVTTGVPHHYVDGQFAFVFGANESAYNGEHLIAVTGASTFTFDVALGTPTPATGSLISPLTIFFEPNNPPPSSAAIIKVTGVDGGGGITSFTIESMGDYKVSSTLSAQASSTGSGTGATFNTVYDFAFGAQKHISNVFFRRIFFTRNYLFYGNGNGEVINFHNPSSFFTGSWDNITVADAFWDDSCELITEAIGVWNPDPITNLPVKGPLPLKDPISGAPNWYNLK